MCVRGNFIGNWKIPYRSNLVETRSSRVERVSKCDALSISPLGKIFLKWMKGTNCRRTTIRCTFVKGRLRLILAGNFLSVSNIFLRAWNFSPGQEGRPFKINEFASPCSIQLQAQRVLDIAGNNGFRFFSCLNLFRNKAGKNQLYHNWRTTADPLYNSPMCAKIHRCMLVSTRHILCMGMLSKESWYMYENIFAIYARVLSVNHYSYQWIRYHIARHQPKTFKRRQGENLSGFFPHQPNFHSTTWFSVISTFLFRWLGQSISHLYHCPEVWAMQTHNTQPNAFSLNEEKIRLHIVNKARGNAWLSLTPSVGRQGH